MSPNARDLLGIPMMAPRALAAAGEFLERLPEIESAVGDAVSRAQDTLDQVLRSVLPIENDLKALLGAAAMLEKQLAATERQIAVTDAKVGELEGLVDQLMAVMIRIDGAAEHLLDRFPGMSAEKAQARAAEIAAEELGPDAPR